MGRLLYFHWGICLLITNLLSRRHLEGSGLLGRRPGDLGEFLRDVVQLVGRLLYFHWGICLLITNLLSRRHFEARGLLGRRLGDLGELLHNFVQLVGRLLLSRRLLLGLDIGGRLLGLVDLG